MKGDKGEPGQDYIVGGDEAKEYEHPWQVALEIRNKPFPACGGTLISSTHVLTAAHCTVYPRTEKKLPKSWIKVLLGEHNVADREFNKVDVAEIINHPDFKRLVGNTTDNKRLHYYGTDYAILRLANPVPFTKKVNPACLPADLSSTFDGILATISGWGQRRSTDPASSPNVLHEADVTVMTNAKCNNYYPGIFTENMLCTFAPGKDACQGDSGGSLIVPENGRQALIGIVSWGRGCADRWPGVYARVTEQMNWILANTNGTFSSTCEALN